MKNKNLDEVMLHMLSNLDKKIQNHNIKKMFTDIIISLDWDDVMYHLMQKNIEFVEKEYGIKDVHNEITDYYYLYRTYPKIADELWNHPENYISGGLIDGAKEFYQELVNLVGEDKIQIVTSSMENVIPLKDKMIRERFGINCKIIHSIFGKHKKHEFTKHTLLIDDFVGNVKEHYINNLNYGIVFNHMDLDYIKKESEEECFVHVTTFKEVIEKVKVYLELGKDYLPNVESCPYCEKDLYNLKFKPYITKTECPYCKNTIVLEEGWVCDPECESDGMAVYYLYTLEDAKELALEIEGIKMKTNEIKDELYFNKPEFKKYLLELKELGKEGFKVGDGVALTDKCLNNIKHSFESSGGDLKSINFPFIGKIVVTNIIKPTEEDNIGFVEVCCKERDLFFTFRQDDAKDKFLELIYREGKNPPDGFEII